MKRGALSVATFWAKHHLDELGDVVAKPASSRAKDAAEHLCDTEKKRKDTLTPFKELLIKLTKNEAARIVTGYQPRLGK